MSLFFSTTEGNSNHSKKSFVQVPTRVFLADEVYDQQVHVNGISPRSDTTSNVASYSSLDSDILIDRKTSKRTHPVHQFQLNSKTSISAGDPRPLKHKLVRRYSDPCLLANSTGVSVERNNYIEYDVDSFQSLNVLKTAFPNGISRTTTASLLAGVDLSLFKELYSTQRTNQFSRSVDEGFMSECDVVTSWNVTRKTYHGRTLVNQYLVCATIGKGSYGIVRLVVDVHTEKYYAMKILNKSILKRKRFLRKGEHATSLLDNVFREIAIMKKLKHPNIVSLYEVIDDPNCEKLYIILEYIQGGPLVTGTTCSPIPEDQCRYYFRDILRGLEYIHFNRVAHSDIKPENILKTSSGTLKIGDFGVSIMVDDYESKIHKTRGTPAFLPPETIVGDSFSPWPVDIWAVGVTLYMLAVGYCPFIGQTVSSTYNKIQYDELKIPKNLSKDLKNLLTRLLDKNPSTRITLKECLRHDWVTLHGKEPLISHIGKRIDVTTDDVENAIVPVLQFADVVALKVKFRGIRKRAQEAIRKRTLEDLKEETNGSQEIK